MGKNPKHITSQMLQDKTWGQKGQRNLHEASESGKGGNQAADRPYLSGQENRKRIRAGRRGSFIREGELFPHDIISQEAGKRELSSRAKRTRSSKASKRGDTKGKNGIQFGS
jgi:hypothetical protein